RYKEKGPPKRAFHAVSCPSPLGHALLDLAFLVDHVLAHHGIVLLHFHLARRVLLVLVGRVVVAGAGGGDQADLVALRGHGRFSFRPSRREHGARRGRRRCRSCRWCAGPWPTRAASPSGSRWRPRTGARAGSAASGGGSCCWRARRCCPSAPPFRSVDTRVPLRTSRECWRRP